MDLLHMYYILENPVDEIFHIMELHTKILKLRNILGTIMLGHPHQQMVGRQFRRIIAKWYWL